MTPGRRIKGRILMGLFDFLRDPASLWVAEPGLKIEIDLEEASFCGVRLGSRASSLSKLGPPTNSHPTKKGIYSWEPLAFDAYASEEILDYFCVMISPFEWDPLPGFPGRILRAGKPLELGPASRVEDLVRVLGEPWHIYDDEEDPDIPRTLYYETRTLEWEIEIHKAGTLHSIALITPPSMESPRTRELANCAKPWPPA
jgi:hypothetical protein